MNHPSPDPAGRILLCEDDPDDQLLLKEAFEEAGVTCALDFVENGEELIQSLKSCIASNDGGLPLPRLVLLDLNMPKKDGREALREIKADRTLARIPVVVLTTSQAQEDVNQAYELGAGSYIIKPTSFDEIIGIAGLIRDYWLGAVQLPEYDDAIIPGF